MLITVSVHSNWQSQLHSFKVLANYIMTCNTNTIPDTTGVKENKQLGTAAAISYFHLSIVCVQPSCRNLLLLLLLQLCKSG